MVLNQKDLESIKDIVEFSITQTERRLEDKIEALDERLTGVGVRLDREIGDLAEINREFLAKMDDHETRITKLEARAV